MKYILRAKTHSLRGNIELPGSKSISNRILIIQALAKRPFDIERLSHADDTKVLSKALERNDIITDVGPAGTAMRFLTALYACQPGEKVLTGSDRMKQRPISILVDALRSLGARISYLEKEGFPPLHIEGRRLKGGSVNVKGNVSSQFITALMLIAPTLPQPLEINIEGDALSRPYITMTQSLMQHCGAQVEVASNKIIIKSGRYRSSKFIIERDWSAAAFWMAFAALANKSNLLLSDLQEQSLQGDQASMEVFALLGIKARFEEGGLRIEKIKDMPFGSTWNFRNHPDLVQPAFFAAAGLGIDFEFNGLDNLRLKETDRISALENELKKFGSLAKTKDTSLYLPSKKLIYPNGFLESYEDHRMVMSMASLSMVFPEIAIENPMVVAKSYPGFWKQVEKFVDVRPTR
ncbi:MAG: 3-phosphoshikimate 1-carboxyvinyltransferase [Salibacteraceae bacterium]